MAHKVKKKNFKFPKIVVFLMILLMWCFTIEPNVIAVKKYKIKNESLKGLRIVFAGDFHVKPYQQNRLKYAVKKINEENPDMVLLIGDYVNMHELELSYPIEKTAQELSLINSKYGVYTVLGNHDYFRHGNKIKEALQKKGIVVLENSSKKIQIGDKSLYIAGIEDLVTGFPNLKKALLNVQKPLILLSHQPDIFPFVPDSVDLTLAGHTHGGQIVIPFVGPMYIPSRYGNRFASGYINEEGREMIVTKGIGTSILPIRFNCMPEIVVIDFE